jgi:hypothetical protein
VGADRPSVILVRPDGVITLACRFGDARIREAVMALVRPGGGSEADGQ